MGQTALTSSDNTSASSDARGNTKYYLGVTGVGLDTIGIFSPPRDATGQLLHLPFNYTVGIDPTHRYSSFSMLLNVSSIFDIGLTYPPPGALTGGLTDSLLATSDIYVGDILIISSVRTVTSIGIYVLTTVSTIYYTDNSGHSLASTDSTATTELATPVLLDYYSDLLHSSSGSTVLSKHVQQS